MAEDEGNILYGKRFRNTLDDDSDRMPGSPGQSREYSLKYDRRTETEFTNRPETANQLEAENLIAKLNRARARARKEILSAQRSVHFFPNVGKFVVPKENTWAAHAEIVKDNECSLCFNPEKFLYFDKIVAEKSGIPALNDPTHPDYAKYEGLRTNIAVLRNDIIGLYLNDGSFDPGDEKYIPVFVNIAQTLGEALKRDTWYQRPFFNSVGVDVANIEGVGAAEMYKFLLKTQEKPIGAWEDIKRSFNDMLNLPDRTWELPPLENTPFSPAGLSAPPPAALPNIEKREVATLQQNTQYRAEDAQPAFEDRLVSLSQSLAKTAASLGALETLQLNAREPSVDEAKKILRNLRNSQGAQDDMESFLSQGSPESQVAKAEAVSRLTEIYAGQLRLAASRDHAIMREQVIEDAGSAAGAMAHGLAMHSVNLLPEHHAGIVRLESLMDGMPPAWEMRHAQPAERLLDLLERGIERAAGIAISEATTHDRLSKAGARMSVAARSLKSVDTLEPPAREESLELAREILRRLKNMQFSDKTTQEMIDAGRPEDKAAFAETVSDAAMVMRNLVAEASQTNPSLLQDAAIREASDAANHFDHAIKLMAAKEIPSSIATAQQIGSDITQNPAEWDKLSGHTVDRLIKSMEGGLEKAAGSVEAEQQQEEKAEQQQSAAEAAQQQSDGTRRRRRRRRSGLGGASQRKQDADIKADDYALKQGRFAEDAKVVRVQGQAAFMGLNPADIATVKALGGKLSGAGQQAKSMGSGDKIAPDDKGFAARSVDKDTKKKDSPTLGA